MRLEYSYLDQLIGCYFNQDAVMWGDTIKKILNCYLEVDSPDLFNGLLDDIAVFFQQEDLMLEKKFMDLYGWDFDPELWNTTAKVFLTDVREQVAAHLKQHYS